MPQTNILEEKKRVLANLHETGGLAPYISYLADIGVNRRAVRKPTRPGSFAAAAVGRDYSSSSGSREGLRQQQRQQSYINHWKSPLGVPVGF